MDKGIIEVSPKQAAMPPGGKQAIRLRMRHQRADEYELPLLVALANGKQFVLNLKWRTLVPGEEHLHLPLREVRLTLTLTLTLTPTLTPTPTPTLALALTLTPTLALALTRHDGRREGEGAGEGGEEEGGDAKEEL